ncbi:MAG: acyloxyacyl hydrolase [Rhodospirillaceae bacterium]|nr:acyloxyacyl hydrolase [Rhodospirillaceae bacterium]MBT7955788.1 acyloxyacyl hydrolase [Rhodospirillaceae bacterium]
MTRSVLKLLTGLVVAFAILPLAPVSAQDAKKDDPAFLSFGAGFYDFNRKKEKGAEFRVEYRSDKKFGFFKPFAAGAYTSTQQGFIGAGVLVDLFLGRRFVLTPSFAPHYYWGGNNKLDLGHKVEFRSQAEIAYRFDNRARLGLAISHYSNASLADQNPGTETLTLYYSLPLQ